jgi:hypothetical protein
MNTTEEMEVVIRKIQKLQAHSENAAEIGNVREAENYATAMRRLMDQYRISMSEVQFVDYRQKEQIQEHRIKWKDFDLEETKRRCLWIENLSRMVCRAYGCRVVVIHKSNAILLIGRENTCKIAEYTIVTLRRAAERLAAYALKETGVPFLDAMEFLGKMKESDRNKNTRRWKQSWLDGFTSKIEKRLESEVVSNSTAIVRVKTELNDANDYINNNSRFSNSKALTKIEKIKSAFQKGEKAAENLDLKGRAVNGKENKKIS